MTLHSPYYYYRLSALCLLLLFATAAKGFVVTPLPVQPELPVGGVHCIYQDSEGYMWYGTKGGICRDNGYQVSTFGGMDIICIAGDRQGRVWFGTYTGLYYLDKRDYRLHSTSWRGEVSALLCDSKGRLWACVGGSILSIDMKTLHGTVMDRGTKENAAVIYEDSRHTVWILYWNRKFLQYTDRKRTLQPVPCPMAQADVKPSRIVEDKALGGYWIATWGQGVMLLDGKTMTLSRQPVTTVSPDQSCILDMQVDTKRRLLYATTLDNLYIYRIEGNTLQPVSTSPFLTSERKILDGMWLLPSGDLWVGGFLPTTFILSPVRKPVVRHTVAPMVRQTGYPLIADRCVSDGSVLWISQGRIGLMLYDRSNDCLKNADMPAVKSRLIEKKLRLPGIWAAEGRRLLSLTAGRALEVESGEVSVFDSNITMVSDQESHLLIGTGTGLYRLRKKEKWHRERIASTAFGVKQAVEDVDGSIYFLVEDGTVFHHTIDGRTRKLSIANGRVLCIAMSPDGTLWIGTDKGMVYRSASGKSLAPCKELCSHDNGAILSIMVDGLRHVWTLTDQALCELCPSNGNVRSFRCQDDDIKAASFYRLERTGGDAVGVGAAGCYLEIMPSVSLAAAAPHGRRPVMVSAYSMGDSTVIAPMDMSEVRLPADQSSLTLYVTTNEPLAAASISYAYRLDAAASWQSLPSGINAIYLNNLPEGANTLQLRATDAYGRWTDRVTLLTIRRAPYWWQTLWARMLFLVAAIGLSLALWLLGRRIHLLVSLQGMRERLSLRQIEIKSGAEESALKDEETMKTIISHIEAHLSDASYGVQQLSDDMCMSRANLYRKVRALSGMSVVEFIRDIRLKHAALLLRQHPGIPISDLLPAVGFTSNSYFTKCFKKRFGVTPSEYGGES